MRILVVDDDAIVLRAVTRLLKGRGHEVIATAVAAVAILATEDRRVDVALLDVDMPEVMGPELAGMLHPSVPVVFHTGAPHAVRGEPCVAKPSSIEEIEAALQVALDQAEFDIYGDRSEYAAAICGVGPDPKG